jgi:two-component system OmpR family sensor kinase
LPDEPLIEMQGDADSGQGARGAATIRDPNGNGAAARDLLFIEQLKVGEAELARERIFLCGLIHDAVATAQREAEERHIEIAILRCDRVVSSRRGDRRRLIQAFDQLLANALKYTPAGGKIEIKGVLVERDFVIEIADQGPGIPPQETELVYDAFYKGSNASEQGGRGIGLTVARAIIEAHGGLLRLASSESGTTAYVELPA